MASILRYMHKMLFAVGMLMVALFVLLLYNYKIWIFQPNSVKIPVNRYSGPVKVLFLTYARSGSTFLGELVNRNPRGFYYFEPLFGVYSHLYGIPFGMRTEKLYTYVNSSIERFPTEFEAATIAKHLSDLFNCNLNRLPVEVLISPFKFNKDIELKRTKYIQCLKSNSWIRKFPKPKRPRLRLRSKMFYPHNCKKYISNVCQNAFDNKTEFSCFKKIFSKAQPEVNATIQHSYLKANPEQFLFDSNLHLIPHLDKKMSHSGNSFPLHNKCLATAKQRTNKCVQHLERPCSTSLIIGAKVIRMRMENVAHLLALDPSIKIIHYVRDPRGMMLSRHVGKKNIEDLIKVSAIEVCNKMMRDVEARLKLEKLYPNNFLVLKYEDLATNTISSLESVYNFLNADIPSVLRDWLYNSTHYNTSSVNVTKHERVKLSNMGTSRVNSTKTAYKWKENLSPNVIKFVTNCCWEFLNVMKYI